MNAMLGLLSGELMSIARFSIVRAVGIAATFAMTFLIVRNYGAEVNGLFQVALSYIMIASTVGRLGQDQLLMREIASCRLTENRAGADALIVTSLTVVSCASALVSLGLVAVSYFMSGALSEMLFRLAPGAISIAWLWVVTEALRGWQRIDGAMFWQGTAAPVAFLLCLFFAENLLTVNLGFLALAFNLTSAMAAVGATVFWFRKPEWRPSTIRMSRSNMLDMVRRGRDFWFLAIITSAAGWIDLIFIQWFADSRTAGIYQPIAKTGGLIAIAITIGTAGITARLAMLIAGRKIDQFVRLFRVYWCLILLGSFIMAGIMLLFSTSIAALWGDQIAPYASELRLYVVVQLFQSIFIMGIILAPMLGLERMMLNVQLINFPMKLVLIYIGYRLFDIYGIFIAIGLCTLLSVLWINYRFMIKLRGYGITINYLLTGKIEKLELSA